MTHDFAPVELPGLEDPALRWAVCLPGQRSPKQSDRNLYDLYWCENRTWATLSPGHAPRTFDSYDALAAALRQEFGTSHLPDVRAGARIARIRTGDVS